MRSNSKRRKKLNARQCKEEILQDRLTNLPDSLKTKILSSLSTKDGVKTSILAKKWKRSWVSVTNLAFDDDSVKLSSSTDNFTDFVNRVLLLRDRSCLQTFRMKCSGSYTGSVINAWIAAALLCTVTELDLSVPVEEPCELDYDIPPCLLPSDIFLCKTLVVLKLDIRGYVNIPSSVSLPSLKTLHISNVKFFDDISIVKLFYVCPVLEELQMSLCIGQYVRVVNIISPTLTSLTMKELPYDSEIACNCDQTYKVVIDAPCLKYLNVSSFASVGNELKNLNHLIKAEIDHCCPYDPGVEIEDSFIERFHKPITDFLSGISQTQSLVLSDDSMEALCLCNVELPTFSNLTYLEVDDLPTKLLAKSPCLETLYLRMGTSFPIEIYVKMEYRRSLSIDDEPPSCFHSHLKVIRIDNFIGHKNDIQMVEYILKNAKVLAKLTINSGPYKDTGLDAKIIRQLLLLPRSSTICKVEVL